MIEMVCEWGIPQSLNNAVEQVNATREIGAKWAKWQMLDAKRLASKGARRYWAKELGGPTLQRALFKRGGIDEGEWAVLFSTARASGIEPLVTPFDLEAVDTLERLKVSAYKIASGDITYRALLERVAKTGKRVFLSTGAASGPEVHRAMDWLRGCEVIPMACDLVYPCPAASANLAEDIPRWREWGIIGYSDHTRELVTGAVAATLGARVLEKHVTLDPDGELPDDHMALTVDAARMYRRLAEQAERLCAAPEGDPEARARSGARRAAYAARPLEKGQTLSPEDIAWLRPCVNGAIGADQEIAGSTLTGAVGEGERIEREVLA